MGYAFIGACSFNILINAAIMGFEAVAELIVNFKAGFYKIGEFVTLHKRKVNK